MPTTTPSDAYETTLAQLHTLRATLATALTTLNRLEHTLAEQIVATGRQER